MAVYDRLKAQCAGMKIEILSADHQNKADIAVSQGRDTPAGSKGDWDVVKLVDTIPGDEAFRALKDVHCPSIMN